MKAVVVQVGMKMLSSLLAEALGVGEDVGCAYVYPDNFGRTVALVLTSDRFPEVEEGCAPQRAMVTVEHRVVQVSEDDTRVVSRIQKMELPDGTVL